MPATAERYRAAVAAFARRDFVAARREAVAALKAQPRQPQLLQLMGVIACESGDLVNGITYLRRAIGNGGDTVDNRINLAKALAASGQTEAALAVINEGPSAGSADVGRLRADLVKGAGRTSEAVDAYRALIDANPTDAEAWNNLGNSQHDLGDLESALQSLQQARTLAPDVSRIHLNIARVLISLDRYEEACFLLEQSSALDPSDPLPLLELGRALIALDHADRALPPLGSAARLDKGNPEIFTEIGIAYLDLAERDRAEQALRFALQVGPDHAPAYLHLGLMLEQANRLDDLRVLLRHVEARGLRGAGLLFLRALLLQREGELVEAASVVAAISGDDIDASTVAHLRGQLADRLGRYDDAYSAFDDMNWAAARSPLGLSHDPTEYGREVARAAAVLTARSTATWSPDPPQERRPPAFLVGFPRSGTTLLDTMLLGQGRTHVLEEVPILDEVSRRAGPAAELDRLDAATIIALRAAYFDELARMSPAPDGALVVDKNPLSLLRLPLIRRLFPDAPIILALRHPVDTVLSCWMQNFKPTEAMSSFLNLGNAARTYDAVFAFWLAARAALPLRVHELRYEALVTEPEATMRPLVDFLELPWNDAVLDNEALAKRRGFIRTPSYAQVGEPIYTRAAGRWQHYRSHLNEVLPVLAPWCERFGYALD